MGSIDKPYNVLFICTGNSARSILAEALLNHLGKGRFMGFSAGSHPKGEVNPYAVSTLQSLGIPVEGLRSKRWEEFAEPGAPHMDFVLTVCDSAAGEVCPVWPGQPVSAHWGMPDPAAVGGEHEVKVKAFRDAAISMKRRIELMLSLPLSSLTRLAIGEKVSDIGRT